MEEMTVVSFFVDREGVAFDKGWQFKIHTTTYGDGKLQVRLWQVGLPFWEEQDTLWHKERQKEYLQRLPIPAEGRKTCYLYEKEVTLLFGLQPSVLSLEWSLFLLQYYEAKFDAVVVFDNREFTAQEIPLLFAPKVPYVAVVTQREWIFEPVAEFVNEEYGYSIEMEQTFVKLHPKGKRILLWTGLEFRGLTPLSIPSNSVWLDTRCQGKNDFLVENLHKKKIIHISVQNFLREFFVKRCIVD